MYPGNQVTHDKLNQIRLYLFWYFHKTFDDIPYSRASLFINLNVLGPLYLFLSPKITFTTKFLEYTALLLKCWWIWPSKSGSWVISYQSCCNSNTFCYTEKQTRTTIVHRFRADNFNVSFDLGGQRAFRQKVAYMQKKI